MAVTRQRLDLLMVARGLAESRETAQRLIMAGEVFVDGRLADKAGMPVKAEALIDVRGRMPYVSRGGYKLAAALDRFAVDVTGRVCGDIGASTGGFTDVLLQRGAAKVYAIDVGYGQLAWKLRNDSRVVVMERTNIREMDELPELLTFASIDVSFISLRLVLPRVQSLLSPPPTHPEPAAAGSLRAPGSAAGAPAGPDRNEVSAVIALVKPQFEAGRDQVGRGGVIRDRRIHRTVLDDMLVFCANTQWIVRGLMASPLKGPAGNIEFLLHLTLAGEPAQSPSDLAEAALAEAERL